MITKKFKSLSIGATLLTIFLLLGAACLEGQNITGSILGLVTDPSGAVIPGASVELTNTNTGLIRKVTTGPDGHYVVPSLSLGPYSIAVTQAGFNSLVKSGIVLTVDAHVEVDFQLRVGQVSQQVTVEASASMVSTVSGDVGTTLGSRPISSLPLVTRNFVDLFDLTTGVTDGVPGENLQGGLPQSQPWGRSAFNINGLRSDVNNFMMDGVDINDPVLSGLMISPPLDSIEEFKLQQSDYAAEFGRAAGGTINIIVKSGTDRLHGEAFEFARNAAYSARNFFAKGVPPLVYNQFGALVGGPIKKEKLFFFMDYQGTRIRQGATYTLTVPTAAERTGNLSALSAQLYNPLNVTGTTSNGLPIRAPFTGNMVSPINTSSAQLLAALPLPNLPGIVNNYTVSPSNATNFDQADVKVDYNLPHNARFFARWSMGDALLNTPAVFGPILAGSPLLSGLSFVPAKNLAVGFTVPISSTEVNEFHAGFTRKGQVVSQLGYGEAYNDKFGIMPGLNIAGRPQTSGLADIGISGYSGMGSSAYEPDTITDNIFTVSDNFSFIRGRNTFKGGFSIIRDQDNHIEENFPHGNIGFSSGWSAQPGTTGTGSGLADFLLGLPDSVSRDFPLMPYGLRNSDYGFYFQDGATVTNRLHVEVGLRYEVYTPLHEVDNRIGNYDPNTNSILMAGVNTTSSGGVMTDFRTVAPRLSFSYALTSDKRTTLRGGAGIFYVPSNTMGGTGERLIYNPPYSINQSLIINNTAVAPTTTFNSPIALVITPAKNPTGSVYEYSRHFSTAFANEINLDLQRQFGTTWLVDVGFVGTKGGDLFNDMNINQCPPGPGSCAARYPISTTLSGITYSGPLGASTYAGLDVKVEKHLSEGLSFLTAYTYSAATDSIGSTGSFGSSVGGPAPQYAYNLPAEYGLAAFNQRQRLTFSYTYALPFGKGKKFLTSLSKPADAIFGGWEWDGIVQYYAGSPITPVISHNSSNSNSGFLRPDRLCNGSLSNRTRLEWFNPSCFVDPQIYTFGDSARDILTGPGTENWNMSLFKNIIVTEGKELQLRLETFNTFNHVNWGIPSETVDLAGAGVISSAKAGRVVQLAAKFTF